MSNRMKRVKIGKKWVNWEMKDRYNFEARNVGHARQILAKRSFNGNLTEQLAYDLGLRGQIKNVIVNV